MLELITGVVGVIAYPLLAIIFLVIDLLQGIFYGLAGIGDIKFNLQSSSEAEDFFLVGGTIGSTNDGGETSTGLIYYLLTSDLIKNLFMSILLLALFLIIIFTAMAFIKNAYASKQKNWQEIVGNAFKGLANFIFIPVCCLLGVWLSNILLQAINAATSTGGAVKMSRKLFICCAYDANHYRNKSEIGSGDIEDIKTLIQECEDVKITFDENHDKTDVEYFANVVDTVYAQSSDSYASIHWWWSVQRHYSLFNINYLIMGVGGGFMLVALLSITFAMIKRLFILLMLFVISPAICAMYPIDDGSAVGNWKKEFIKYTISAYGSVVALNLFFSILPIIENINVIGVEGLGFLMNDVFQLLIMVCGLFVVKEFMGTLSGWIGGDNAMATGESLKKSATGAVKKYAGGTAKVAGGAFKSMGKAKAAKDAWREEHLKPDQKHLSFGQWIQKQGVGLGSMGKDAFFGSLKGIDKAAFGGEAEKMFKARGEGKKEFEKESREERLKKSEKADRDDFYGNRKKGTDGYIDYFNSMYDRETDEHARKDLIHQYIEGGKDLNIPVEELYDDIARKTGKRVTEVKREYGEIEKEKQKEKEANIKAEDRAANEEAFEKMGKVIAGEINKNMLGTPAGGRSHVEDTMMERGELNMLKSINDHLAKLVSLEQVGGGAAADNGLAEATKALLSALSTVGPNGVTPGFKGQAEKIIQNGGELTVGKISGRAEVTQANFDKIQPQIDAYNSALETKKVAEQLAKDATNAFVEEMKKAAKGNAEALKVIEKFEKATNHTVEAVQKLAKEINDLLKK